MDALMLKHGTEPETLFKAESITEPCGQDGSAGDAHRTNVTL